MSSSNYAVRRPSAYAISPAATPIKTTTTISGTAALLPNTDVSIVIVVVPPIDSSRKISKTASSPSTSGSPVLIT